MREEQEVGILLHVLQGKAEYIPGAFDTGRLIGLAERHRVTHALLQAAREGKVCLSDDLMLHLESHCRETAMRSLGQLQELKRIAGILNKNDIGYACIKGPQLSRMIYGREAAKESVDLDILLVQGSDLFVVHHFLIGLGYTRCNLNKYKKSASRKLFLVAKREVHYFNPEQHIAIDLHVRPGANTYLTASRFRNLLAHLVNYDLEGTPVPVLPDEAYFVYLCYHGALHQFSRLAWLTDIRAFLQLKKAVMDYAVVLKTAHELGAERHTGLALYLLKVYFGDEIPEPLHSLARPTQRMHFLAGSCRSMLGKVEQYGSRIRGRLGKMAYMMALIHGCAGKADWFFGVLVRKAITAI